MPYVPFRLLKLLFLALTIGAQVVVYRFAARIVIGDRKNRPAARACLAAIIALLNVPLVFLHYDPEVFNQGFVRTDIMMPFYAYETLSVAIAIVALLVSIGKFPFWLSQKIRRHAKTQPVAPSESRRTFIRTSAIGLGAYTFGGALHSIYSREEYRIDRVPLTIRNLPPRLDGLTISMISDIHSGMYMLEEDMLKYADAVNNLKADMIFIPGDFVTSQNSEIVPLAKAFAGLKSKYGTYTCLGNHDFFADPKYITGKLRDAGMKVLRNETEEIEIDGATLMLSGVDDGRHANFKKVSFEAASLNTARILLCHKPYFFETAVAGKFDLMLSGHTHGGQIVIADVMGVKVTPAALASQYISGRYKLGGALMYVSRGIGTIGLPIRVNCPPEITLFTLRSIS